ncbi:MAG: hypothetical protein Q8R24_05540 [Legionellaceae bacterium]|nr:hypothetical protein [Legionellaceae bacterium]
MNLVRFFRLMMSSLFLCLFSMTTYAGNIVYTQLTSTQSQPATNPSNLVSLETVDGIDNIGSAATKITINVSGFYFVMLSAQAGSVTPLPAGDGYVDVWLVLNNTPLPNTNSRKSMRNGETGMAVTQSIIQLNKGDSISVGFSASNPALGLITIPATKLEPAVTSAALTIYKL